MERSEDFGYYTSQKRAAENNNTSQETVSSSNKEGGVRWNMTKQGNDVVFTRKDLSPDYPGKHFTVPLSTLNSLKTGQGLDIRIPNCILWKTSSGFQFVRKVR